MIAAPNFYENDYAMFWIAEGILYFTYKADTALDYKSAQAVVTDRIHFQNEKSYPILCDIRGIVTTNKAARDYLAKSGSILTQAVGLLVDEKVLHTIGTFYLQISKPTVPTKIFTTETAALEFLNTYANRK